MRCPFLREAQVKYCDATAPRKMIVRMPGGDAAEHELCSTADYLRCHALKEYREESPHSAHCPFLHESLAQYCAASSQVKYVPYNEATLQRCGYDNYRYCDLYQRRIAEEALRNRAGTSTSRPDKQTAGPLTGVSGVTLPAELLYTPNHWWIDRGPQHSVHLGVDAFLARVLSPVSAISFVTQKGAMHPSVTITVKGVELHLTFPVLVTIRGVNAQLRVHPEKLTREPYTCGWLFEGVLVGDDQKAGTPAGASIGRREEAAASLAAHAEILPRLLQEAAEGGATTAYAADGGALVENLCANLRRDDIRRLYDAFFSPLVQWSR